jgi:hypothetical protein
MAVLNASRIAAVTLLAVARLAPAGAASADGSTLEYAVKASYLVKFAPFVEWPPSAFAGPASPFNLCVVGEGPLSAVIDAAAGGQHVGAHPIVVRHYAAGRPGRGCHLLFVGQANRQSARDTLQALVGQPVLTVTDASRGVPGGIIEFLLVDGRVRFDIDPAAAKANGIAISSKLLGLAVSLRKEAP